MYLLHVRERSEVLGQDGRSLLDTDTEALGEPVGLHPVGETVGDHLRLRAHGERDISFGLDAVDPGRGGVVDVDARHGRPRPARVVGQMGDHPELDLVVVGDQQLRSCAGTNASRKRRPMRLRTGMLCRLGWSEESRPGAGDGLIERGMDPPVGRDLGRRPSP